MIVVAFFSGIQLLSLGVMGEYVGRIYDETRQRPKYIVESSYGLKREDPAPGVRTGPVEDPVPDDSAGDRAVTLWL